MKAGAMEPDDSPLQRTASFKVLLPIVGLLGGLVLGAVRAWIFTSDPLLSVTLVIAGGIVGSSLGMAAVLATAYPFRKADLSSLRGLLILGLIAAIVTWFVLVMLHVPLGRVIP
jgi:hypothetical protein